MVSIGGELVLVGYGEEGRAGEVVEVVGGPGLAEGGGGEVGRGEVAEL